MKKNKIIPTVFSYIIIITLMALKAVIMKDSSNLAFMITKDIIILLIITIANLTMKNDKRIRVNYNLVAIFLLSIGCIIKTFDSSAFILIYLFINIITNVFMSITKYRYEISIVGATFLLITLYIILGLMDMLKFSKLYLLIITVTSLIYLYKNKEKYIGKTDEKSIKLFTIFTIMFIIAVLGGVERYVHSWDEYSYWAYAAKACINEKSIYSMIEKLGTTRNYPPVATLWHYIISSFSNGFSEPNLYIGLTILSFICFMPILKNAIDKNKSIILFTIAILSFPLIFSGAYSYTLVYVDLLLAALCTTAIVLYDLYQKQEINRKLYILSLIIITLLKPNGFVFSCTLIFLFYLRDLSNKKIKIKDIFLELKKYILPGIIVLVIFASWTLLTKSTLIKSTAYDYSLMPAELKSNLSQKLEMRFILNFVSKLIESFDKTIVFSFVEIPLFIYLVIVCVLIYITEEDKKKNAIKVLYPYVLSYAAFFFITALSLFVMFSKYEAENLASFQRYLAPINIAYFIFAVYRLANIDKDKILNLVILVMISLAGFQNITFFATDIRARRNTKHISEGRTESFEEVIEKTEKNAKVYIINQEDIDSIMPLWYARYYCYPRTINSSSNAITWKVRTKENKWDLKKWGLTDKKLEKHLIEYKFDYIYFYSQTDELEKELDEFVDDVDDYDKGKLFKIIKVDEDSIKFELVK